MSADDTLAVLAGEVGRALQPLRSALDSEDMRRALFAELGWQPNTVPASVLALTAAARDLEAALAPILEGMSSAAQVTALLSAITRLVNAIQDLSLADFDLELGAEFAAGFPPQLIDFLIIEYLRRHQPRVAFVLRAFGLMRSRAVAATPSRPAYVRHELATPNFAKLVADPGEVLENAYGWRTAAFNTPQLLVDVRDLLIASGLRARLDVADDDVASQFGSAAPPTEFLPQVRLVVPVLEWPVAGARLSTGVSMIPARADGALLPGVALLPYAHGAVSVRTQITSGLWFLLKSSLDVAAGVALVVRPGVPPQVLVGFNDSAGVTTAHGALEARLEYAQPDGVATVLLGSPRATRFEFQGAGGRAGLRVDARTGADAYLELELAGVRVVVDGGEGDGLLRRLLPAGGIGARFDLSLGLSTARGLYFNGSGRLEVEVPTRVDVAGLRFESVRVGVQPQGTTITLSVGASVTATLGPVSVTLRDVGLRAAVDFPAGRRGNLGPLDFALAFKPPTGVGIAIDAGPVHGGGFIALDAAAGRYSGALQLSIFDVTVAAVGLLETQLPGGTPEYSFLILITAEFPPLQLGLGFTLNGLGGLAGVHRTVAAEPLRAAIRDGSAARLLFPRDPVRNGPQLVNDLGRFFPTAADRFVFGPIAKIGYGTPPIVEADLGVVLELPAPFRIVLLGVLRAGFPTRAAPVVRLNLTALGVLDLGAKTFALDASLFDSTVAGFDVAGDMALRLSWGDAPTFALAVGGFNPHFAPPPGFPALRRVTVALGAGANPRLALEAYVALTSNTLQLGAHAALHAAAAGFTLDGALGFDALVTFDPFGFRVDVAAAFALAGFGMTLASVRLDATLEGPRPWHVTGHLHVSVLFVDVQVDVDARFGDDAAAAAPPAEIAPWAVLQPALEDPANWAAVAAPATWRVAAVAAPAVGAAALADPVGGVAVRQTLVPLGRAVTKLGERRVAGGARTLAVTALRVGDRDVPLGEMAAVTAPFAPAQFEDLTDAQKLSRPSFEPMQAGLAVTARAVRAGTPVPAGAVAYETVIVPAPARAAGYVVSRAVATAAARSASAASASARRAGLARFAPPAAAPRRTALDAERYVVASTADLAVSALAAPGPHGAVAAALAAHLAAHPADRGAYHVVPAHEAEAA